MIPLTVPDSGLARAAAALAAKVEPPFLLNHSRRSFHFAAELLSTAGRAFDPELLYIGSMLHDIALGTSLDDGVTPFHLRGAGVAANQLVEAGRPDEDAMLVYDAIALHLDLATADDERPEVAGVHLGAVVDVLGLRLEEISAEMVEAVFDAHPRLGMKAAVTELVVAEARKKPYSPMAVLVRDVALVDLIHGAPFDG
jgi:hypothetical protein